MGAFNIQFMVKDNVVKVIECNLRASDPFRLCAKFSTIISSKKQFQLWR